MPPASGAAALQSSVARYETWLAAALPGDIVPEDVERKHEVMAEAAFSFLRATYWRWAELVPSLCPEAMTGPAGLAVGDLHLENFGTWRDADGRLVFGINDFDEADRMPLALDLLRLATSLLLAADTAETPPAGRDLIATLLDGYRAGLGAPRAIVLEREHADLRELLSVPPKKHAKFWEKLETEPPAPPPEDMRRALAAALPEAGLALETRRRRAGAGSLGRPRFTALATWRGGPVVREAKRLVPPAWSYARGVPDAPLQVAALAAGRLRAPDPWYRIDGRIVVRRLSPSNRKLDADKKVAEILAARIIEAMGRELAMVHVGAGASGDGIEADLASRPQAWLFDLAIRAAQAVEREHALWKAGT